MAGEFIPLVLVEDTQSGVLRFKDMLKRPPMKEWEQKIDIYVAEGAAALRGVIQDLVRGNRTPVAAVVDLQLRDGDDEGLRVIRELRQAFENLYIFVWSKGGPVLMKRAEEAGAQQSIEKYTSAEDDLLSELTRLLEEYPN